MTPAAATAARRGAAGGAAPEADERFFGADAERLAALCHRMAERFAARRAPAGRWARSPQARSDARHVAVEFVHPVIVGKRALPALALTAEGGPLERQVDAGRRARRHGHGLRGRGGLRRGIARDRGCLTVAFAPCVAAEWQFDPPADDPFVAQELAETAYHLLWELVHVFFEHRGLLQGREARAGARHRRVELPLPVPGRVGDRPGRGAGRRARLGADEGARDRPRCARRHSARAATVLAAAAAALRDAPRPRRAAAGAGQRRLGHRRHGRGGRHAPPAGRRGPGAARST